MSATNKDKSLLRAQPVHNPFAVYLRGIAMGAADIVPGVSGGTVAFITGIYEELLNSIRSINTKSLSILLQKGPIAAWHHVNGNFLLSLLAGILTSIALLASVVSHLLDTHPLLLWSFFFGLIIASSLYMFKQLTHLRLRVMLAIVVGILVALGVGLIKPTELNPDPIIIFLSGSIAICAMILPGISGSFILVLLGVYPHIILAIKELDWILLFSFLSGCGVGLLAFSHLLGWLFQRYHNITLAFLTGILIGSLNLIWPWKHTLSYYQNSKGVSVALEQENVFPSVYQQLVGPPDTLIAISLMVFGVVLVLGLEKVGEYFSENIKK